MPPHMVSIVPHLTTYGFIRRVRVSVPLIPDLIDNQRYFLPDALPAPAGEEKRSLYRPRIVKASAPRPDRKVLLAAEQGCEAARRPGRLHRSGRTEIHHSGCAGA
jgi:hypothetical protein